MGGAVSAITELEVSDRLTRLLVKSLVVYEEGDAVGAQ